MSHGQGELAALLEKVRAETADMRFKIREVRLALGFETLFQVRGNDVFDDVGHPFVRGNGAFDGDELAADAENDRCADLDVDVGSAAVNGELADTMKQFHPHH